MKKIFLTLFVAAAAFVACNNTPTKTKPSDKVATPEAGIIQDTLDTTNGEAKLPSSEIAYIDMQFIFDNCNLAKTEAVALQQKYNQTMESYAQKEKNLQNKGQKIQNDDVNINNKRSQGLMTTADYTQQMQDLQKRAENFQKEAAEFETNYQNDMAKFQEESAVINNRIAKLIDDAVKQINSDKRYKMIVNAAMLVDAAPELDMTAAVLAKVNELYAAEK